VSHSPLLFLVPLQWTTMKMQLCRARSFSATIVVHELSLTCKYVRSLPSASMLLN